MISMTLGSRCCHCYSHFTAMNTLKPNNFMSTQRGQGPKLDLLDPRNEATPGACQLYALDYFTAQFACKGFTDFEVKCIQRPEYIVKVLFACLTKTNMNFVVCVIGHCLPKLQGKQEQLVKDFSELIEVLLYLEFSTEKDDIRKRREA